MKATNATEVLIAAKWILKNVGWIKGTSVKVVRGDDGQMKYLGFCTSGALSKVETAPLVRGRAFRFLTEAVGDSSIIEFNDHTKTTKKMVLAAFDRAIKESGK